MDEQSRKLAFWETVGSVLWFLMDACWMLEWSGAARLLIAPTVVPNLWAFRYTERSPAALAITAAMNSWLAMNCCWMVADLGGPPVLLTLARVFLGAGIVLIAFSVIVTLRERQSLLTILGRFRRFRFGAS
ncbi:MAG TPA: hypothetical protein VD862_02350 [Candidatus Paceibacterota bacterium]|nr:hypothetical protein [Candidatus Paceibacterota bacterium]